MVKIRDPLIVVSRRVKSTPGPDTFEKYRDTPSFLSRYICKIMPFLLLAESSTCTTNLYHDVAPVCVTILFAEVLGSEVVGTLPMVVVFHVLE